MTGCSVQVRAPFPIRRVTLAVTAQLVSGVELGRGSRNIEAMPSTTAASTAAFSAVL